MEYLEFEELGKSGNIDAAGEASTLESLMCLSKWVYPGSVVNSGSLQV